MPHLKHITLAVRHTAVAIFALLALGAPRAEGQLPNPSAGALGLGDNYTALARGYASAAWNPAGLGMPDDPPASFALLSARATAGLDPISLADIKAYQGQAVPLAVREQWLDAINQAGGEQGSGGSDLTFLAGSARNFGLHLSTSVRTVANLGPGAAELILFGNAGRNGTAGEVSFAGSSVDALATSTVAVAYAQPISTRPGTALAVGATMKYIFGHFVFSGHDDGGVVRADPLSIEFQFPMVMSDTGGDFTRLNKGGGTALDLGVAYQAGPWSAGAMLKNVVNRFEWDESALSYRPGQASFTSETSDSDFHTRGFSAAPAILQDRVRDMVGGRQVSVGGGFQPSDRLLLSADLHHRTGDNRLGEAKTHVGIGAELRPLRWLPIRTGGAVLDDGYLAAAGLGLEWGLVNLTASFAQRNTSLGMDQMAMFTLSSMRHRPR
jgi:hypothetical protein